MLNQPPFFRSPGTQRQTAKVSNIPTKSLLSQDLISDSTWDIYEQLNNGGKCGDSVDGRGMPVCAYFQLNAKFTFNIKVFLYYQVKIQTKYSRQIHKYSLRRRR